MQRPDLIVAASAGTALLVCLGVTWWQLDGTSRDVTAVADAAKVMSTLPANPNEVSALEAAAKQQQDELAKAVAALAPPLKSEYMITDAVSAVARVRSDLVAVRTRAERSKVTLPSTLPFASGVLDPDDSIRSLQLAQLALVRLSLESIMDAGILQVNTVTAGRSWLSPVAANPKDPLAAVSCDIELVAGIEPLATWLKGLTDNRTPGLSLRSLQIEPEALPAQPKSGSKFKPEDARRVVKATVVLLTPAQPTWKLSPEPVVAPANAASAAAPAAPATRGLGSKRVSP